MLPVGACFLTTWPLTEKNMVPAKVKIGFKGGVDAFAVEALARTDQFGRLDKPFCDLDDRHREVVIRAKRCEPTGSMDDILLGMTHADAINLAIQIIQAAAKEPLANWERDVKK